MTINMELVPLLIVALLVWVGVFGFLLVVDNRVKALERRIAESESDKVSANGQDFAGKASVQR